MRPEEGFQELDREGYNHFGIVSRDAERLHVFYRKGPDHYRLGTGVYRFSDNAGRSWSAPELVLPSRDGDDVRVGNIGTTHDGTLVVVFIRKTYTTGDGGVVSPSWQNWFYTYLDPTTRRWSAEYLVEPPALGAEVLPIAQGQPYGRMLALPDGRLLLTGYVHPSGDRFFYLQNWFGERVGQEYRWTRGAPVLKYPSADGYQYSEHSVLAITASNWLAVSRGRHALVFFKSTDAGQSWSENGELVDALYPNGAYGKLVSPMLDLLPGPTPRVLLTYADRETNQSYYRVGRVSDHFLNAAEPRGRVDWGPAHAHATNAYQHALSGYPSGVFLDDDPARYLLVDYDHRLREGSSAVVRQFRLDLSQRSLAEETAVGSPELLPPSRVTGLTASPWSGAIGFALQWEASADEAGGSGLARYRVDVASDAEFTRVLKGWRDRDVGTALRTSLSNGGSNPTLLQASTTYYARVRAHDSAGNVSPDSVTVAATTRP
ncbi:MAG: exo-alpha-sialidase [Proteobacteria bacterium]|nr:exo-alpha-sialidase [Pseudomonadota bacterium]